MYGRAPSTSWLLILVCVALLLSRVGSAHLHLCFDGKEPAASLHFVDGGHHADHHVGEAHDDLDLSLIGDALNKSGKLGLDLSLLLFAAFCLSFLLFTRRHIAPVDPPRAKPTSPRSIRPPLRGPPLHAA